MQIEHLGLDVPDPAAMADWYVKHLGMRVVLAKDEPVPVRFLADSANHVMIELYNNPAVTPLDFPAIDPLVLHLAFASKDVKADYQRLLAAGATVAAEPKVLPTGDEIAIARDPWGFAVQLVRRRTPMI
ncbi:MAG TPA: VOC family protein [Planctomycetota bacterium]|nr:VOC family protein [Planctomycetota bacterium]